jgi:DNA-binding NtrC family response regulator
VSSGPRYRILLVDDEPGIRFAIRSFLEVNGYDVEEADTCQAAEASFRTSRPDAAILDYLLPDGNTLEVLPHLRAIDPGVPLLILTAHGSIDLAVRAIKEGAEQFLTKPVELPALLVVLERLLESQRSRKKELAVKSRQARDRIDPFLGESAAIRRLEDEARRVLTTDSPVLILGETGTGKGVLAAWLHSNGSRMDEAFVDLNCAGFSRELLGTELFGHEKGAFTGAAGTKVGLLEVAHRGTVFLDEIGDMDGEVQPKLLKVLEEKRFRRLGDVRDRRIDIRLIAATHQDLGALVRQKKFRSDLYFRISTIPLAVPALRERLDDIPLIAHGLLEGLASELGRGAIQLGDAAIDALRSYPWPGNIRELRNVLERAILLDDRGRIEPKDLRFDASVGQGGEEMDSRFTLEEVEQRHIARVLQEEGGRVEQAAQRLGVPRSSLYQKIKKYGLRPSRV